MVLVCTFVTEYFGGDIFWRWNGNDIEHFFTPIKYLTSYIHAQFVFPSQPTETQGKRPELTAIKSDPTAHP